ncbi:MAG: efflux RND transporter periplasmic adaptor subunit [Caulobacteraceae bacterium]
MISKILKSTQNIVIGFFLIVFLMGFFSKSVINLFLPKVQVAAANKSPVERTFDLKGVIIPKDTTKVFFPGDVIIDKYFVKVGDTVSAGDPIFRINTGYGISNSKWDLNLLENELKNEKLVLDSLLSNDFAAVKNEIALLEEKFKKSKDDLKKQELLYSIGSIPKSDLDALISDVKEQEFSIEKNKAQLKETQNQNEISIKETENDINKIQMEISEAKKACSFYSNVDDEGIYYSEVSGIVLNLNLENVILPQDSIIIETSVNVDKNSLLYSASINDSDNSFIRDAKEINVDVNNGRGTAIAKITNFSKVSENNTVTIIGEFTDTDINDLVIGQKLGGKIKKIYPCNEYLSIPKASIVPIQGFSEGKNGLVYLLDEKDGLLGKEYIAKEKEVKIIAIGDKEVIVSGLESYNDPKVIVNLTYKVKNGVKVFLCQ